MTTDLLGSYLGWAETEKEDAYGTKDTNSTTEYLHLRERPEITETRETVERERVKATAGADKHFVTKSHVEVSLATVIAPIEDSDGAVPACHHLLLASGHSESTSGTAAGGDLTASYQPLSRNHGSAQITFYLPNLGSDSDWTKITCKGVRGNLTLNYSMDGELMLDFEGVALYAEYQPFSDLSADEPAVNDYHNGQTPFTNQGHSFTLGSVNTNITNLEFSTNWATEQRESVTASEKLDEMLLYRGPSGNRPGGSFDPVVTSVGATDDALDMHRAATEKDDFALDVTRGSNEFHLTAPAVQLGEVEMADQDSFFRYDTSYVCNEGGSGDDDYKLEWKETSS